ncbi:MAG TPA: cation:proton antiporter [Burkholderiales bacterium]|jgi:Kef-type K+ transport system membrane component KefB
MTTFLPQYPFPPNPVLLFGLLLLAGVAGGELVKRALNLPRIVGYVLIGLLLGASGSNLLDASLVAESWIFVEIALGLVLFELGRRLHFKWLRNDPWLLATGLLESALAFGFVYLTLAYFGVEPIYAAVAAAIGVSTSPAVVLLVAQELKAEGQVTERALNLTALNSVVAFVLTTMLLSWIHHEYRAGWVTAALHPLYLLGGSLVLGFAASVVAIVISRWLGQRAERQYALLLALIVLTIGAARMLELSVLLALLALGVFTRNLDTRHDVMAVDLSGIGQIFYVVLFVVSGAKLHVVELMLGGGLAVAYVAARFAGKMIGVMSLAHLSGVRPGAALTLGVALMPMSGLALAMVHGTADLYPEFGARLSAIVLSAVLILELIGPVAVQYALKRAGEARDAA